MRRQGTSIGVRLHWMSTVTTSRMHMAEMVLTAILVGTIQNNGALLIHALFVNKRRKPITAILKALIRFHWNEELQLYISSIISNRFLPVLEPAKNAKVLVCYFNGMRWRDSHKK